MALRPGKFQRGRGKQPSCPEVSEFLTLGECPRDQTDARATVGGRRAHFTLDRTRDAGRTDRGGQEFQWPSGQWQSGEYNHACFGAAVWVFRPSSGRPCGLPIEPHRVRWKTYKSARVCHPVWGITGYDKDTVFLVVPDESEFRWRVPLVVETCTISRIINII